MYNKLDKRYHSCNNAIKKDITEALAAIEKKYSGAKIKLTQGRSQDKLKINISMKTNKQKELLAKYKEDFLLHCEQYGFVKEDLYKGLCDMSIIGLDIANKSKPIITAQDGYNEDFIDDVTPVSIKTATNIVAYEDAYAKQVEDERLAKLARRRELYNQNKGKQNV
jgi:hypothetical protein